VDAIGSALKAGTNCGSCRGEIRQILDDHRQEGDARHADAAPVQARESVSS
jgi:assimilatory nitrate reductase catalytic subunit